MNTSQKIAIGLGIVLIILMGLFPPWRYVSSQEILPFGYSFLLSPPNEFADVNLPRLIIQWIGVFVVVCGFILILGKRKERKQFYWSEISEGDEIIELAEATPSSGPFTHETVDSNEVSSDNEKEFRNLEFKDKILYVISLIVLIPCATFAKVLARSEYRFVFPLIFLGLCIAWVVSKVHKRLGGPPPQEEKIIDLTIPAEQTTPSVDSADEKTEIQSTRAKTKNKSSASNLSQGELEWIATYMKKGVNKYKVNVHPEVMNFIKYPAADTLDHALKVEPRIAAVVDRAREILERTEKSSQILDPERITVQYEVFSPDALGGDGEESGTSTEISANHDGNKIAVSNGVAWALIAFGSILIGAIAFFVDGYKMITPYDPIAFSIGCSWPPLLVAGVTFLLQKKGKDGRRGKGFCVAWGITWAILIVGLLYHASNTTNRDTRTRFEQSNNTTPNQNTSITWDKPVSNQNTGITWDKPVSNQNTTQDHNNSGVENEKTPQLLKAPKDYNINRQPKAEPEYTIRGNTYLGKGQYDNAIKEYDKALDINRNDVTAYCNRGIAYAKKGQYMKALNDYSSALFINPQHAVSYYNRALAYLRLDFPDSAIRSFKRAARLGHKGSQDYLKSKGIHW